MESANRETAILSEFKAAKRYNPDQNNFFSIDSLPIE